MPKHEASTKPRIAAAGFCALDIVFGLEDPAPKFYAGGTCGNVAAGLAFFGWDATPIARIAHDHAGEIVRQDLMRWGVDTSFLGLTPCGATPIVLEKLQVSKNGMPKHRFLWNCPDCGSYFPPFKSVLQAQVQDLKERLGHVDVFFADRVSRSAVELANHLHQKGALIYFEPSAAGDPNLFGEMLAICDVLKYSAQRARTFSELLRKHSAYLEIETLGEDGLRFRTRKAFSSWQSVSTYEVRVKDTAGSGDWTSIGLISHLFGNGKKSLEQYSKRAFLSGLQHAQALAAFNCQFEAPRGGMYQLSKDRLLSSVEALAAKKPNECESSPRLSMQGFPASAVCPSCSHTVLRRSKSQLRQEPKPDVIPGK
jgi:fructokinase